MATRVKFYVELDIDFNHLIRQKRILIDLASEHPDLEGVISVYDEIQDQAFDQGHGTKKEIYGIEEDE